MISRPDKRLTVDQLNKAVQQRYESQMIAADNEAAARLAVGNHLAELRAKAQWPATWPVSVDGVSALDSQPAEDAILPHHRPVSRAARIAAGLTLAGLVVLAAVCAALWVRWAQ